MSQCSSSSPPLTFYAIQPVPRSAFDEVVKFINSARTGMFPDRSLAPDDETLFGPNTCFLEARNEKKRLVAVIGYVPYNHRFPAFDYRALRTAEVVRLYVVPSHRRSGLAARLFLALRDRAVENAVQCFYLHTHPFLPGAIAFWHKHGFEVTHVENDPVWRTTHMRLMLDAP